MKKCFFAFIIPLLTFTIGSAAHWIINSPNSLDTIAKYPKFYNCKTVRVETYLYKYEGNTFDLLNEWYLFDSESGNPEAAASLETIGTDSQFDFNSLSKEFDRLDPDSRDERFARTKVIVTGKIRHEYSHLKPSLKIELKHIKQVSPVEVFDLSTKKIIK